MRGMLPGNGYVTQISCVPLVASGKAERTDPTDFEIQQMFLCVPQKEKK